MHDAKGEACAYDAEIAVMRYMGWGYGQLCEAPAELIDVIIERMLAENHYREKRDKLDKAMKR